MTPRTRAGFVKFTPVPADGRIALVAPASPFPREEFDAGVAELRRLGWQPAWQDTVFDREAFVAGSAAGRAAALMSAWAATDVDAVLAVRGGYGSVELLPRLSAEVFTRRPIPFIGYSDVTSLHVWLNGHLGLTSVHGPMIDRRLSKGAAAYDIDSFRRSLSAEPLGEVTPEGLAIIRPGESSGPIVGGTLTQLTGSLGTPFDFRPPKGCVLFLDEVGERPYRLRRLLVQLQQSGRLADASAVIFGQLPQCDEPTGAATARETVAAVLADFPGPVLAGFPSGHTTSPLLSIPFGVHTRVVARGRPCVVFEEAAAA